jgi:hypothetical protein
MVMVLTFSDADDIPVVHYLRNGQTLYFVSPSSKQFVIPNLRWVLGLSASILYVVVWEEVNKLAYITYKKIHNFQIDDVHFACWVFGPARVIFHITLCRIQVYDKVKQ